jgi:hypothetical protein
MNDKQALALAKSLQAQAGDLVDYLNEKVNPPVPADPRVEIIGKYLNGQGRVIIDAAKEARLALSDACALVEQESGGKNIFGCDAGGPFCHEPVTRELVQRLINQRGYRSGNAPMQGVGLTQLTWYVFVLQAEERGGAHLPFNQCVVGFNLLRSYLQRYPRERAIASYNAGEGNWMAGRAYAQQVMAKAKVWEGRLGEDEPTDPDKPWIKVGPENGWSKGAGIYVSNYPTHYDLRPDVKKLAEKYINLPRFYRKVSANTYTKHPPANPNYERVSVDFWDWKGRGHPLDDELQSELTEIIFDDPTPPLIQWLISNGKMWVRDGQGWRPAPPGAPDSDAPHNNHIHVSYRLEG